MNWKNLLKTSGLGIIFLAAIIYFSQSMASKPLPEPEAIEEGGSCQTPQPARNSGEMIMERLPRQFFSTFEIIN